MTSASGSSNESRTRWESRYSIVVKLPRRFLVSSISAPMCWLGVTICTRTQGSEMVSISPAPGSSAGLSTTSSALPSRSLTRYLTEGAEAMRSRSNSRSSRSWMISMWSRPRKPQRKPKPSATELSGWKLIEASLRWSFSSASRNSGQSGPGGGGRPRGGGGAAGGGGRGGGGGGRGGGRRGGGGLGHDALVGVVMGVE